MVSVYALAPRWFIRPRNTDWIHTRQMLPQVCRFTSGCAVYSARSLTTAGFSNLRYFTERIQEAFGSKQHKFLARLDRHEFHRSRCDLVFSHAGFPENGADLPVVWQNSILDPQMCLARGRSQVDLQWEIDAKKRLFAKSAAVLVSTQAEKRRLSRWFPGLKERFAAVPLFLPYLGSISDIDLESKLARQDRLRCLFVGDEAYRKGIDRVLEALSLLPARTLSRVELTIVSRFSDGSYRGLVPSSVVLKKALSREEIMRLMREADVYLMPSRFESYGIAFIEAMSQGAIPVVPDWEVQRELADDGRAGLVTRGEPLEIAQMLEHLLDDPVRRRDLSYSARDRFVHEYAPKIVAGKLCSLFHHILGVEDENLQGDQGCSEIPGAR